MSTEQRLFIGQYPTGLVFADSWKDDPKTRDYVRLGYLNYETLVLELEHRRHFETPERKKLQGEIFAACRSFIRKHAGGTMGNRAAVGSRYWEGEVRS